MFIEVKDAVKKYGKGEAEVFALNKASLNAEKGEICVILGSSGSGKSTLLNMLGGLDVLDSGSIMIDGREISKLSSKDMTEFRRSDIGFVFQFYNLMQNLTALENVELAMQICKHPLDASEVLAEVGLEERMNNFPAQLSGGEQQRVAIARAMVNRPAILLADEPTGNLDPENSWEIMKLLQDVHELGTTVLVVSHNEDIVNKMQKRVITLHKGQITSDARQGGYLQ